MKMRLKAWWDGNLLEVRSKGSDGQSGDGATTNPRTTQLDKVALIQAIWGDGMTGPGDKDYIANLVKPMGLDPSMTILDLGAGLGGPTRIMAEHFGPWVNGLELDKDFAEAGMALSEKAGLAKKASVAVVDLDKHEFRPGAVDGVLSKELLFKIKDKEALIKKIAVHLKDRGRLLMTDYIRPAGVSEDDIAEWIAADPEDPEIWTSEQYEAAFNQNNMDLRIHEDVTQEHIDLVTGAWQRIMTSPLCKKLNPETGAELVKMGEFWQGRLRELEKGNLILVRYFALKRVNLES
ncbi:MAG: methyltransferase domain-containing protein [Pseudomonadota bacterium]